MQVENTLFKVHRYFLARESSIFNNMFTLPEPVDDDRDKAEKGQVVKLPEVTVREIEALMTFFYDGYVCWPASLILHSCYP